MAFIGKIVHPVGGEGMWKMGWIGGEVIVFWPAVRNIFKQLKL